jgi:septin family protein
MFKLAISNYKALKIMKRILLFLFLIPFISKADVFDDVVLTIKSNKSDVVSKFLNANVEITLLETESLCSKAQAEQMLKKFFDTYPSKIINIKHRGASAQGAKYAIASYETESGLKLRLYIFMKNDLIHELKVERE